MTKETIIKRLSKYLDSSTISRLKMVSQPDDLVLVMTVAEICKEFNGATLEDEAIVSDLLVALVKCCF